MEVDINQSLVNLEKSLQQVDSARSQVERVVNGAGELQKIVSNYLSVLSDLKTEIQNIQALLTEEESRLTNSNKSAVEQLSSKSDEILNIFKTDSEKITGDFEKNSNGCVANLSIQINNLSEHVVKLSELEAAYESAMLLVVELEKQIKKFANDTNVSQYALLKKIDECINSVGNNAKAINSQQSIISSDLQNLQSTLSDKSKLNLITTVAAAIIIAIVIIAMHLV